jgi:peptidoglycan hydrolase-like protein with peptidoglycan-binding domain
MRSKLPLLLGSAVFGLLLLGGKKADAKQPGPPPLPKPGAAPKAADGLTDELRAEVERLDAQRKAEEGKIATDAVKQAEATETAKRGAIDAQKKAASEAKASEAYQPGKVQDAPPSRTDTPRLPAGYDPARARAMARSVSNHLANRKISGYARELVKQFQRAAGITADGIYGGHTRGALIYFGVSNPPRPFFIPTDTLPYVSPEQRK